MSEYMISPQDLTGRPTCRACPAGYYCVANSTTYTGQICPSGHYCPQGTRYDIEYKCPQGTFNNLTGTLWLHPLLTYIVSYLCLNIIATFGRISGEGSAQLTKYGVAVIFWKMHFLLTIYFITSVTLICLPVRAPIVRLLYYNCFGIYCCCASLKAHLSKGSWREDVSNYSRGRARR